MDIKSCKANIVVIEDFNEDNSLAFIAYVNDYIDNVDVWYIDKSSINDTTDCLDWFAFFKIIPQRQWFVMIANNKCLQVQGVNYIKIQYKFDYT